jgi:hypothetical protein
LVFPGLALDFVFVLVLDRLPASAKDQHQFHLKVSHGAHADGICLP